MAETGRRCREICEACFQRLGPLEETTIGAIGAQVRSCAMCLKATPSSELHHVHLDGLPTQELVNLGRDLALLLHKQAGWTSVTFEFLPTGEIGFSSRTEK